MIDWFNFIGTVASIAGGTFSFIQARKAKGYADGKRDAKKEVKDLSFIYSITEFKNQTKEIKNQLNPSFIVDRKANEIQTSLNSNLTEYSDILGSLNGKGLQQLNSLYDDIRSKSSRLTDDENLSIEVDNIRTLLGQVISFTSKFLEKKKYQ